MPLARAAALRHRLHSTLDCTFPFEQQASSQILATFLALVGVTTQKY